MSKHAPHLAAVLPSFTTHTATYKTISLPDAEPHPVKATVYLPPKSHIKDCPLMVSFHGGNFVTGSRDSLEWQPLWQFEWAVKHSAIIVSADYQLIPESNGHDVLQDMVDLMRWLQADLPAIAANNGFKVDLTKTLVLGESAGGRLAMLLALLHKTGLGGFHQGGEDGLAIKCVISKFGGLDAAPRSVDPEQVFPGIHIQENTLDRHLQNIKDGKVPPVCTSALLPERFELMVANMRVGRTAEFWGKDPELDPMHALEVVKVKREGLVPMWCFHGTEDDVLPTSITRNFAARVREVWGDSAPLLESSPRGPHGVGNDCDMVVDWVKEGLEWCEKYWP